MCIAIVKPKNKEISDEILSNCFENNPDGAGIAYARNNELYYVKGIFDVDEFINAVRKAESIAEGDMLIHCRIGTSGLRDKNNCHPHVVNEQTVLIHNGILDIDVPDKSKKSDTILYIEKYLKGLPIDFIKNKAILKLIGEHIGTTNKFAFINNKGESAIVNKGSGVVDDGIWYSNRTYKTEKIIWSYSDNWNNHWWEEDYSTKESKETDMFGNNAYMYKYMKNYIDNLFINEYYMLEEYPLIDKNNYRLVPFDENKYKDTENYILLEDFSYDLYDRYLGRYYSLVGQEAS